MATANLAITSPTEGLAFTIRISNVIGTDQVKDTTKYTSSDITYSFDDINFITGFTIASSGAQKFAGYPGSNQKYITWRDSSAVTSVGPSGQFPLSGFSLDIWSDTLYDGVMSSNRTWSSVSTGGSNTFPLYTNKYTLIYNYGGWALAYCLGGTLTITLT